MEVQVEVLPHSHEDCKRIDGDRATKLCIEGSYVTGKTPGKGPCKGDSGGPLFISQDGHHKLIGITSYGVPKKHSENVLLFPRFSYLQKERRKVKCEEFVTNMYTKVNQYVDWIENKIGGMRLFAMHSTGRKFSHCIGIGGCIRIRVHSGATFSFYLSTK